MQTMGASIAKVDRVVAAKPAENAEAMRAPPRMLQSLSQATELKAKRKEIAQKFSVFVKEMLRLIDHSTQSTCIIELS